MKGWEKVRLLVARETLRTLRAARSLFVIAALLVAVVEVAKIDHRSRRR